MSDSKKPSIPSYLKNFQHPDQFGIWLGYKIKNFSPEKKCAETELQIRKDHLSPAGRVHGGVVSAFFDFSCGAAVFSTLGDNDYCSTIELKINYLKPVELGNLLTCKAQVVFRGKRLCVIQGSVFSDGQEDPVAIGLATFNVATAKVPSK